MRTIRWLSFLLFLGLLLTLAAPLSRPLAAGGEKTFEGELVDSRCFLKLEARGEAHQGCAKTCAKSGLPAGVVTADGHYYTVAVQPAALVNYMAETVRVTGLEKQGAIVPSKMEVKKGGRWREIQLPEQMM